MDRLWDVIDCEAPARSPSSAVYPVAIGAGLIAVLLTLASNAVLRTDLPFLFPLVAVLIIAPRGGFWPALLVIVVSVSGTILADGPSSRFTSPNLLAIIVFLLALAAAGEIIVRLRVRSDAHVWQLAQRKTYLQSIFDTLPAAMLALTKRGEILACNQAAATLFGYRADELHGEAVTRIIALPTHDPPLDQLATAIARYRLNGELAIGVRRDGSSLEIALALSETTAGRGLFVTLYVHDESEAKRTAAIQAELLSEVQQMGRATALGQLGGAIAHELNQPLASAANYAGAARKLLATGQASSAVDDAISECLAQVFRASTVLTRLREFVQPEVHDMQWLEVGQIMAEAVQLARLAVRHGGATLQVEIDPDVGYLMADRIQIQQVLLNLIVNATEAVRDRPDRLVNLSVTSDFPGFATIAVSDSGLGVAPTMRDRLFKPFSSSKRNGLGVGLAISRSIVESNGGKLWLDASAEQGARFCFTLRYRLASELGDVA